MSKSSTLIDSIPKSYRPAYRFLRAGKENREYVAYLAYRGRIPWEYSIPLESVIGYLKYLGAQATKDGCVG